MAKAVDNRIPDLTHQTHAELLQKHVSSVKELATNLPNSMRAYVSALAKNGEYVFSVCFLGFFAKGNYQRPKCCSSSTGHAH